MNFHNENARLFAQKNDINRFNMDEKEVNLERFKEKISLFKFISGTLIVGLVGTAIKCSHDERELKMKEFDSIGKYAQYALAPDRKRKKDFSQYFAIMSNHPDYVKKWKLYDSLVNIELADELHKQEQSYSNLMQLQREKLIDSMRLHCVSKPLEPKEIERINEKSATREAATIKEEFDIADVNAKVLALPTEVNTSKLKEQEDPKELARNELAKAIVDVLRRYDSYCFNSARIRDWGRKKNRLLSKYGYDEINIMLGRLLSARVLVTGNCENKALFQYNSDFDKPELFR